MTLKENSSTQQANIQLDNPLLYFFHAYYTHFCDPILVVLSEYSTKYYTYFISQVIIY